jgi:hypothetical protein
MRRKGGEKGERGKWGRDEGARSGCCWKGNMGLEDRRTRRKEVAEWGVLWAMGVIERSCAVAWGIDINTKFFRAAGGEGA